MASEETLKEVVVQNEELKEIIKNKEDEATEKDSKTKEEKEKSAENPDSVVENGDVDENSFVMIDGEEEGFPNNTVQFVQEHVSLRYFSHHRRVVPTRWQRFKRAVYNPETGAVFGRNYAGWGRLGIFYAIFYAVLASLFTIGLEVTLFHTMNTTEPKWQLGDSLIGTNPGLGFRPLSQTIEEGALIRYNCNKPSTTAKWVNLLDQFFEPYHRNYSEENVRDCSFEMEPPVNETKPNFVCGVDVDNFGPCAPENKYGYNGTSPCVFIKLNRIYGWVPEFYTEPERGMPADLAKAITDLPESNRSQVWISCNGVDPIDRENVVGFNYYPGRGFPGYYYPYLNLKNYLSPLIAVEILNPKPNLLINIECRAWAKNILYKGSSLDRQGSVQFGILRETV